MEDRNIDRLNEAMERVIDLQLGNILDPKTISGITEQLLDAILSDDFFRFFNNIDGATRDFIRKIQAQYEFGNPLIRQYIDEKHYLAVFKKKLKKQLNAGLEVQHATGKTEHISIVPIVEGEDFQKALHLHQYLPWLDESKFQPRTEVIIFGKKQLRARIVSQITIGIVYPIFPQRYALALGYELPPESEETIGLTPFGFSLSVRKVNDICLHLFRKKILTACYFTEDEVAVLSLQTILQSTDLGFNQSGWFVK